MCFFHSVSCRFARLSVEAFQCHEITFVGCWHYFLSSQSPLERVHASACIFKCSPTSSSSFRVQLSYWDPNPPGVQLWMPVLRLRIPSQCLAHFLELVSAFSWRFFVVITTPREMWMNVYSILIGYHSKDYPTAHRGKLMNWFGLQTEGKGGITIRVWGTAKQLHHHKVPP